MPFFNFPDEKKPPPAEKLVTEAPSSQQGQVIPFGKYKGQPVEVLRHDPAYVQWLSGQDWFRDRYALIHTLVINNFGEAAETPEHNALQVRFLDRNFCLALLRILDWDPAVDGLGFMQYGHDEYFDEQRASLTKKVEALEQEIIRAQNLIEQYGEQGWLAGKLEDARKKIPPLLEQLDALEPELAVVVSEWPEITIRTAFEDRGWDVALCAFVNAPSWDTGSRLELDIELKPSLGDDYPAVLRQMRANDRGSKNNVLVFDRFAATGASLEQVKAIFKASRFKVIALADILAEQEKSEPGAN